jgi:hypothetical protein
MREIQATIGGFMGAPKSVFAALDDDTGILVVAAVTDARPRREGCFVIRTEARADGDGLFDAKEHLAAAISAYFALSQDVAADGRTAKLRISERAMQANPAGVIETDGFDVHGPKYRVSPDARNEQIAVLALCRYARMSAGIGDTVQMADTLMRMLRGEVVTI